MINYSLQEGEHQHAVREQEDADQILQPSQEAQKVSEQAGQP